jgi:hypothetical protein
MVPSPPAVRRCAQRRRPCSPAGASPRCDWRRRRCQASWSRIRLIASCSHIAGCSRLPGRFAFHGSLVLQAIMARWFTSERLVHSFRIRLTFSRAMPASAPRSLCVSFWRTRMRPPPTSCPNASARLSSARATRRLEREEACCRQYAVGVAQPKCQQGRHVLVELRVGLAEGLEGGTADEAQFGIAQRADGSRPSRPVDHRQLSDQRARSQNREDAFIAARRHLEDRRREIPRSGARVFSYCI